MIRTSTSAHRHTVIAAAMLLVANVALAVTPPVVLRTTSRTLDIRDGDRLLRQEWSIDPAIALDVSHSRSCRGARTISSSCSMAGTRRGLASPP
jgi:hypothetical protein